MSAPGLRLVEARREPARLAQLVSQALEQDWGDEDLRYQVRDYFAAVAGREIEDLSVAVVVGDDLHAVVHANDGGAQLGYFGLPLIIAFASRDNQWRESIERSLFEHYAALAQTMGRAVDFVEPHRHDQVLGALALAAAARGGSSRNEYRAVIDLTLDEAALRRALRKSYRSLVNWGKRNLQIVVVNHANPDRDCFDAFQAFHTRMAGRQTRPQASWDAMFDNLVADRAELVAGYLDGVLMAATFIRYSRTIALYSVGVYDRGEFDKPLSHWPVYLAIQRAQQMGCRSFDLGEVFVAAGHDDKARSIAFFKKGFTDRVVARTIWTLSAPTNDTTADEKSTGDHDGNNELR